MDSKVNFKKLGKLEPGSVYAVRLNYIPSGEHLRMIVDQFSKFMESHQIQFIILGSDYTILNVEETKKRSS